MEAAFIVPISCFCAALVIALNFYIHNVVWYQAAAYEAVLAANGREGETGDLTPEELAAEKLNLRLQDRVMPGEPPAAKTEGTEKATTIRLQGYVLPGFSGIRLTWKADVSVEKIRPAEYIRQARLVNGLLNTE